MLIQPIDDDPERNFNEDEKRVLTKNLEGLIREVRTAESKNLDYVPQLFQSWHYRLFNGVRSHAGKYRSRDYGEPTLVFGGHRSAHRDNVASELELHSKRGRKMMGELKEKESLINRKEFISEAIMSALFLHALFIKIHPFRDGNGRVGRLIITYTLSRFNIPPISFEVPKQEYINCLDDFYRNNCTNIRCLYELAIRIYKNQLDV